MRRLRLVVLASGRGSNLESLIAASREGRMEADVVRVIANRPDAQALAVARSHGVEALCVPSAGASRDEHDARVAEAIDPARPDLVVLAGYMRILGAAFLARYQGRLVNIHPSLLPAFPGLEAPRQAHARGVRIAGCTTHFVTSEVDAGPIILQAALVVDPAWSPEELAARILALEHEIYPRTIDLLAKRSARLEGGRVVLEGAPGALLREARP